MARTRLVGSFVVAAALMSSLAGCGGGDDTAIPTITLPKPSPSKIVPKEKVQGQTVTVHVKDHKFTPATVTIHPGDAVRWVFEDDDAHTVTGLRDKGLIIDSPVLRQGSEYQVVFKTPEEIDYICAIHPNETGKVIVTK